jgi:ribosomal protein L7/L12
VRFELGGQAMRMDLSLTPEGINVSSESTVDEGVPDAAGDESAEDDFEILEDETSDGADDTPTVAVRPAPPPDSDFDAERHTAIWSPVSDVPPPRQSLAEEGVTLFDSTESSGEEETAILHEVVPAEPEKKPEKKAKKKSAVKKSAKPDNTDDTLPVWTGKARAYREPGRKDYGENGSGEKGSGTFHVFLSSTGDADKRKAAAQIIAEVQGIGMKEAAALLGNKVVPVARGITEIKAGEIRQRLKESGLSCRITQKRD